MEERPGQSVAAQAADSTQSVNSAQPAGTKQASDSTTAPQHQVAQKFMMGWTTPFLLRNLLKYGKGSVVLLDATLDEWVRGFRGVQHAQQDTTGACEGYHSAIKGNELAQKHRLQGRRLGWLLHELFYEVCCHMVHAHACSLTSFTALV